MARKKAAKHSDSEVVDRAAEAGDVSAPKRKKTVAKTANTNEEDKQIRLPRAAKSAKTEQIEVTDTSSAVNKNAKAKNKTLPAKNASSPAKMNSKVKTTGKKNKESEEKADNGSMDVKNSDEAEPKKTRTKAVTKKAGMDTDDEPKGKAKGKAKKNAASESTENLEAPVAKKRRAVNAEAASKENKPKGRAAKKKNESDTDTKSKGAGGKTKTSANNEVENDTKVEESIATAKTNKKSGEDKITKPATARKRRGRKNEASPDEESKDDEESKKAEKESVELVQTSDTESQESQNNQLEATESTQSPKRGKNVKKKEVAVPQKKATKIRGKAVNRNNEAALNEDDAAGVKISKDMQKKQSKDTTTAAPAKKVRGRKGAGTATVRDENGEKSPENFVDEKKLLNLLEVLNSNNDDQKLSEDNDKEQDSEKEEKYSKMSGILKKSEETATNKNEVNENNVISTSVREEEN